MQTSTYRQFLTAIGPLVLAVLPACVQPQGRVRSHHGDALVVAGDGTARTGAGNAVWSSYWGAVQDAAIIEPEEISHQLQVVEVGAPDQVWREWPEGSGRHQIKVVTWAGDGWTVELGEQPNDFFVWVTLCPRMAEFCRRSRDDGLSGEDLDLRLRQRIGLPPNDPKKRFIEYWVYPDDLFRPAAVASIDTNTVGPSAPKGYENPYAAMLWSQTMGSYSSPSPTGYPWTRLGYTYDWGYGGPPWNPEMGDSEYVIRKGCKVWIASVTPTGEYGR